MREKKKIVPRNMHSQKYFSIFVKVFRSAAFFLLHVILCVCIVLRFSAKSDVSVKGITFVSRNFSSCLVVGVVVVIKPTRRHHHN